VFIAYYRYQRQDAELINSQNVMVRQKHPVWRNVGEAVREVALAGQRVTVQETRLSSTPQRLLVWHWNWLNGPFTINPYWAKFYEARGRLLGHWDDAAAVIVYTPYDERPEEAASILEAFLRDMLPALTATLEQAAET
jgi:EpsI family protein